MTHIVTMPPTLPELGVHVLDWRLYPGRQGEHPVLGWVLAKMIDRAEWVTWRIAWTGGEWDAFEGNYFRADDPGTAEDAARTDFGRRTHREGWA
jgi:hypothetical protein